MPDTHIHSIDAYTVLFAGVMIKNGGGDGGFCEIELPQKFDSKSGVHGDVVSYKMGNEVATCRLTLLQQSSFNESLAAIYENDRVSTTGTGIGLFQLEDANSGLEISGDARIIQPPTYNIQAEAQEVTWTFQIFHPSLAMRPRGYSISFAFSVDLGLGFGL